MACGPACLRMIAEEADFFVGIYAHRYGFVPDGDSVSITEAEYLAASSIGELDPSRLPRLIYLVDENTRWRPAFIDRGESEQALQRFKRRLRSRHMFKEFSTPDALRASVAADLHRAILRKDLLRVDSEAAGGNTRVNRKGLPSERDRGDASPVTVDEWNTYRQGIYRVHRDVFLAHTVAPSEVPGQRYDIAIYLVRHHSTDLSDVVRAEFFLGPHWQNQVFTVENEGNRVGILVSAHGTFLCTCRIIFRTGDPVCTSRYIDVESLLHQ